MGRSSWLARYQGRLLLNIVCLACIELGRTNQWATWACKPTDRGLGVRHARDRLSFNALSIECFRRAEMLESTSQNGMFMREYRAQGEPVRAVLGGVCGGGETEAMPSLPGSSYVSCEWLFAGF